jgi:purine-nucleoside phosphorylase
MSKSKFWRQMEESAADILREFDRETLPATVVVLGSGFKPFANKLSNTQELPFADVHHFPVPTVAGHGASFVVGEVDGLEILVMTGRIHMYEGHEAQDVVYPLRVLSTIGIQNVLLTNACGSVDPSIKPGTAMVIKDHLNLTGKNCLIGDAKEFGGSLFVDMGDAYNNEWRQAILKKGDGVIEGVYAGLMGPNYETDAEVMMLNQMGANVVGMSTVQETIAAVHLKLKVAGISFVTNMAGANEGGLDHQEVLDLAKANEARLCDLLTHAIKQV